MSKNPIRRNKHGQTIAPKLDLSEIEYVIYCRKSSEDDEKQKQSIASQLQCCIVHGLDPKNNINLAPRNELYDMYFMDEALELEIEHENNGYFKEIVEEARKYFVIYESHSAKIPSRRTKWNKLIELVKDGKIKGILSYAPDRQCRNMLESGQLITFVDENKLDLKYTNYHFENTPDGKMMLGMRFVFSKQYSDNLSKVVTRGNEDKRGSGGHLGHFKLGYKSSGLHGYEPDPDTYPYLKQAFYHKIYDGWSYVAIEKFLKDNGVKRFIESSGREVEYSHKNLSEIFKDTLYYGVLELGGNSYDQRILNPNFGEPIITQDEHNLIMEMSRVGVRGTLSPFEGGVNDHLDPIGERILKSDEGHYFSFYPRKKEDYQARIDKLVAGGKLDASDVDVITSNNQAYKAINTKGLELQKWTKEITYNDLLPYLFKFFDKITLTEENYKVYTDYYRYIYKEESKQVRAKNKAIDKKIENIDIKIEELASKYGWSDDPDTMEFYIKQKEELKQQRADWNSKRLELTHSTDNLEATLTEFLRLGKKIGLLFKQAHWVRRKKLIQLYISNLIIHRDNTVTIRVYPHLESLIGSMVGDEGFEPTTPSV